MRLIHPKTNNVFEVADDHGEMLLRQGFYSRTDKPVEPVATTKTNSTKRSRKNERPNKQG